jgi:HSP20 family protein
MYLTKFKPGREFLRDSMVPFNTIFDSMFGDTLSKAETGSFFKPAVDVKETETAFELAFTLPGIEKDQIKIEMKDNRLTVSGERKLNTEEKTDRYHRVESSYGSFSRSFMLPENINAEAIDAAFNNGILNISIPKAEMPSPKNIEIK